MLPISKINLWNLYQHLNRFLRVILLMTQHSDFVRSQPTKASHQHTFHLTVQKVGRCAMSLFPSANMPCERRINKIKPSKKCVLNSYISFLDTLLLCNPYKYEISSNKPTALFHTNSQNSSFINITLLSILNPLYLPSPFFNSFLSLDFEISPPACAIQFLTLDRNKIGSNIVSIDFENLFLVSP